MKMFKRFLGFKKNYSYDLKNQCKQALPDPCLRRNIHKNINTTKWLRAGRPERSPGWHRDCLQFVNHDIQHLDALMH